MTDYVTQERLEELERRFRADRRKRGARIADRHWLEEPLRQWAHGLEGDNGAERDGTSSYGNEPAVEDLSEGDIILHETVPGKKPATSPLDDDAVTMLAVGMRDSLPVRDSLILSLISSEPCSEETLLDMAANPKEHEIRRMMMDVVADAFGNAAHMPDRNRCERGLAMLDDLIASVPSPWQVQPFAAMAYILWWADGKIALRYALASLTLDKGCALATIVLSMLSKGVEPAWRDAQGRMGGPDDGED